MRKEPQYFYIHDHQRKEYTYIGPFWNDHYLTELVTAQQRAGRDMNCCTSPSVSSDPDYKFVLISEIFPGMALSMREFPPKR